MYTGTVWGITLLILGSLLSLGALQLVMTAAAPGLIGQAARNLEDRSAGGQLWLLFLGTLGLGLAFLVVAALANAGPAGKVLQFLILVPTTFTVAAALAVSSWCVGGRLPSPDDSSRPWRRLVRGATALGLSWVVPVVGWFLILPGCAAAGVGALMYAIFQGEGRREAAQAWRPVDERTEPSA